MTAPSGPAQRVPTKFFDNNLAHFEGLERWHGKHGGDVGLEAALVLDLRDARALNAEQAAEIARLQEKRDERIESSCCQEDGYACGSLVDLERELAVERTAREKAEAEVDRWKHTAGKLFSEVVGKPSPDDGRKLAEAELAAIRAGLPASNDGGER